MMRGRDLGREEPAQALALLLLGDDPLVEPGPLHRDGGVVGERGQEVEVVQGEAVRQHRGVHVDDPDDLVLVPQGRAHGAADAVEADGVAGPEARIDEGVGGQDGDAVLGDAVGDRLGDADLAAVGRVGVAVLDDHRDQLVRAVLAEHQEAAVGGDVVEHDVHDLLEHLLHRPDGDERLRHLGEDPQDPVGLLDLLDVGCFLPARACLLAGVGEELAQLADAADDRARFFGEGSFLVEHDLAFERLAEGDLELAEEDAVAVLEGSLHDGHPVDLGAVLRLQVLDADPVLVAVSLAWVREMPKSLRTIWQSGERPMRTSPSVNVYDCGVSPSW